MIIVKIKKQLNIAKTISYKNISFIIITKLDMTKIKDSVLTKWQKALVGRPVIFKFDGINISILDLIKYIKISTDIN